MSEISLKEMKVFLEEEGQFWAFSKIKKAKERAAMFAAILSALETTRISKCVICGHVILPAEAALEGPSEEERKDLIDHFDWLRRLCNEDIYKCLFCKEIRALIEGNPAPEEEVRDED